MWFTQSCRNFDFVVIYAIFPPNPNSQIFRIDKKIAYCNSDLHLYTLHANHHFWLAQVCPQSPASLVLSVLPAICTCIPCMPVPTSRPLLVDFLLEAPASIKTSHIRAHIPGYTGKTFQHIKTCLSPKGFKTYRFASKSNAGGNCTKFGIPWTPLLPIHIINHTNVPVRTVLF